MEDGDVGRGLFAVMEEVAITERLDKIWLEIREAVVDILQCCCQKITHFYCI